MGLLGIEGIEQETALGRGAFGVVYRAWQPGLRRHVAVKVLVGAFDEAAVRRFERECATIGSLSEVPGILGVHAAGRTAEGSPYLVTPCMEGGSLADRLRAGSVPPHEVVEYGIAVGRALVAAHRHGVLHLDVKPANVLLDGHGQPHLADFGIARFVDAEQGGHTATIAGTPGFAAPEIFDGRPPTAASDVYGLGATLHALLTGQAPFTLSRAGGLSGLLRQIAEEPPPDLRPLGLPEPLCAVVERAMAKNPTERYRTMADLVDALEAIQPRLDRSDGGADDGARPAAVTPHGERPSAGQPETLDEKVLPEGGRRPPGPGRRSEVIGGRSRAEDRPVTAPQVPGSARAVRRPAVRAEAAPIDGPGRFGGRRHWGMAAGVALAAVVAVVSLVGLLRRDPAGSPAERLASPAAEAVETGLLLQWLVEIREIDRRLFLVSDRDFGGVCQEGLDSLARDFEPVPEGAARLIPAGLTPALAAQAGPLRSAWTDLIDASMRRLQRCATGALTADEDAQLHQAIADARAELDRLLQTPPTAAAG